MHHCSARLALILAHAPYPQGCHSSYWLGYNAAQWGAANFLPIDKLVPSGRGTYSRWGAGEPNGRAVPELCTAANQSLAYGADMYTYGWSDTACERQRMISMCRIMREWRSLVSLCVRVCARVWVWV
jgi:hypothetical protein